jgi:fibronectin type 3 domain-containing protein
MKTRVSWLFTACLLLVLTVSAACGRKTPPLIPDSPRPEVIKDIRVATRDSIAFLSWPLPARNVEGKSITSADIQRFLVYRSEGGLDRKKTRYTLHAEIDMANPAPAVVRNGMVFWIDRNLKYGQTYGYRVRAVSVRGGVSAWSDEARVAPLLSLAVPKGFTAQANDGFVQLSWEPVTTRMDGSRYDGYVGYNLYRGTETGQYEETPLNKEPLIKNSYKDTAVANGKMYFYMIRSVDSPALPWKEGLDSQEVSATPRDLTPPAEPTGLTVVPGVGRVFLLWSENKERDLAGYHVYRSTRSGKGYERLTDKILTSTTFSDETVKPGTLYYYKITAVDQAGNESTGSEDKGTSVEKRK